MLRNLNLNPGAYALLTLHRPANVDDPEHLLDIINGLEEIAASFPVVFPAHPRTQKRIREFGLEDRFTWGPGPCTSAPAGIRITEPAGYLDFVQLMDNALLVLTDSGGIQEETTCLGVPCVTIRENTERPITVTVGTNVLAGVQPGGIRNAIQRQLHRRKQASLPEKWDGNSAVRVIETLVRARERNSAVEKAAVHAAQAASIHGGEKLVRS